MFPATECSQFDQTGRRLCIRIKFRMNNFHLLLLCFVSGGLCSVSVFTKMEGEHLSFGCIFNSSQSHKFLVQKECKENRTKDTIILETSGVRAEKGKYSINYDTDIDVFYVSITQLDRSDSGLYRCGVGNVSSPQSQREFELKVTDAMCDENKTVRGSKISVCAATKGPTIRVGCSIPAATFFNLFFCREPCKKQDVLIETSGESAQRGRYRINYKKNGEFYVTIENLSESDSGLYRCGVDVTSSPNPCQTVEIGSCTPVSASPSIAILPQSTATPSTLLQVSLEQQHSEETGYLLPLALCLAVLVVVVAVSLLLYRKIKRNSSGSNVAESSNSENIEISTF